MVINIAPDRKHEIIHHIGLGFSANEIALFFDITESEVKRYLEEYLDKNPTPPTVA